MPASRKIITKLRERRQIEADLRKMLTASSDLEFRRQAQRIASLGSQVIPAILGNLEQADAPLLAAMGTVATYLDREEMITALRQTVLQSQQSDQGRIGAMTILERFLGEPPDDNLLESLADPKGTAISSLREVLAEVAANPAVLIQYVEGLDRQEPDVVLAVAAALRDMEGVRPVEPLRMMAQDVRAEIAEEALQALGSIRQPQAATALQTLAPIVHPELRPLAERSLRRLRFTGVEVRASSQPDPNWRSLVSPVDGMGQQSVWFIQENRRTSQARFLNVLLSDGFGAVEAVGHSQIPTQMLPPRRPLGHLHDIALPDGSGALLMLEATFDLGRRMTLDALALNRETQIPVAGPLRLLSPWLWGVSGADSLPPRAQPKLSADDEALLTMSGRLLNHPAFATWSVRTESILQAAHESLRHPGWNREVWVRRLTSELLAESSLAQVLSRRLETMGEWLLLAGDESRARMAWLIAGRMSSKESQDQPFVQALVRRDLDLVLDSLNDRTEPIFGTE
jgi:hypothetical protein